MVRNDKLEEIKDSIEKLYESVKSLQNFVKEIDQKLEKYNLEVEPRIPNYPNIPIGGFGPLDDLMAWLIAGTEYQRNLEEGKKENSNTSQSKEDYLEIYKDAFALQLYYRVMTGYPVNLFGGLVGALATRGYHPVEAYKKACEYSLPVLAPIISTMLAERSYFLPLPYFQIPAYQLREIPERKKEIKRIPIETEEGKKETTE